MADEFTLTPQPVRLTAATSQQLKDALDVSAYDRADVLLWVAAIEGTASPTATVRILTGMQVESENGWVVAGTFTAVTASNTALALAITGLLKYMRWELSVLGGTGPSVTFVVSGMLRDT